MKKLFKLIVIVFLLGIIILETSNLELTSLITKKAEKYEGSLSLTPATYTSPGGETLVISEDGTATYGGTNYTVTQTGNFYKIYKSSTAFYQLNQSVFIKVPSGNNAEYTAFRAENIAADSSGEIFEVYKNDTLVGKYGLLQAAVDNAETGSTIKLVQDVAIVSGAYIKGKKLTFDGNNKTIDKTAALNGLFYVESDAELYIQNVKIDGGATGFAVDYNKIVNNSTTIPLIEGSADSDPKNNLSPIMSKGYLEFENSSLVNNYTNDEGGTMNIMSGSAFIYASDISHNYSKTYGGGLSVGMNITAEAKEYPVELIYISNSTLNSNYSTHGGALYTINTKSIYINESDFKQNTVTVGKGGAITIRDQNDLNPVAEAAGLDFGVAYIINSNFEGNYVGNDGFAIQDYQAHLYMSECTFKGNVGVHATTSVGTISIEAFRKNGMIEFYAEKCIFENNDGPASVYGDHASYAKTTFKNCTFKGNNGICSLLLYASDSLIESCTFTGEKVGNTVIDARSYATQDEPAVPKMTIKNTTITGTEGATDILVRKQQHDSARKDYVVTFEGNTTSKITVWDNNQVEIEGKHTGDIILDSTTPPANVEVKTNATLNGMIDNNLNTYSILLNYPNTEGKTIGEIVYVDKDKTYTQSEFNLMISEKRDNAKLVLYTETARTNLWDYTITGDMALYGSWEEHTHTKSDKLGSSANGIYRYCECGYVYEGITLTAPTNLLTNGTAKEVVVSNELGIESKDYSIVYYKQKEDFTWKKLSAAPIDAGTYRAKILYDGLEASVDYSIQPSSVSNPNTSSETLKIILLIVGAILSIVIVKNTIMKIKQMI